MTLKNFESYSKDALENILTQNLNTKWFSQHSIAKELLTQYKIMLSNKLGIDKKLKIQYWVPT